jgi:hypothetical protein
MPKVRQTASTTKRTRNPHRHALLVTVVFAGGLVTCSAPEAPKQLPTLLVNNPSCAAGECRTTEVRLFDWDLTVPQPFWGYKVIGEIHGPSACLTFPAPWRFSVIGPRDTIPNSPVDTVVFTGTVEDLIYVIAMDSAGFHAQGPIGVLTTIRGRTDNFTAADARGWRVTLSGDNAASSAVPTDPCTP